MKGEKADEEFEKRKEERRMKDEAKTSKNKARREKLKAKKKGAREDGGGMKGVEIARGAKPADRVRKHSSDQGDHVKGGNDEEVMKDATAKLEEVGVTILDDD